MTFKNIQQIQKHVFFGNYGNDQAAFKAIDEFVLNELHSIKDRAESLRIMYDKGMGIGRETQLSDIEIIQDLKDNI